MDINRKKFGWRFWIPLIFFLVCLWAFVSGVFGWRTSDNNFTFLSLHPDLGTFKFYDPELAARNERDNNLTYGLFGCILSFFVFIKLNKNLLLGSQEKTVADQSASDIPKLRLLPSEEINPARNERSLQELSVITSIDPSEKKIQNTIISITRTSQWTSKFRDVTIFMDAQEIARVANNQTVELQILPGKHIFHAKIDWVKSEPIEIFLTHGQNIQLKCGFKSGSDDLYLNQIDSIAPGKTEV